MPNLRRGMMAAAGVSTSSVSAGTLWAWGSGGEGALGDGTDVNKSSPVQIGSNTDWQTVDLDDLGKFRYGAAGDATSAVNGEGKLFTWGWSNDGQGGRGNTDSVCVPTQVGSLTDWAACTGGYNMWATKTDGTWWFVGGRNWGGGAGQGDTTSYSSPVQIGSETYWAKPSGNNHFGFCITNHGSSNDGQLWAVGANNLGNLGVGDTTSISSPVQVGSLETWSQVSVGGWHVVGIRSDGALFTWGLNDKGQLGDGSTTDRSSPVQIGTTEWAMAAASYHGSTGAIKTDGTLWVWGNNYYGELGVGDTTSYSSPVQVGSLTDWKILCTPVYILESIKTDGTLWTCGRSYYGGLGNGTGTGGPDISSPAQVGSDTDWLVLGNSQDWHSHAIRSV